MCSSLYRPTDKSQEPRPDRLRTKLSPVQPKVALARDSGVDDAAIWRKHKEELIRYATVLVGVNHAEDVLSTVIERALRRNGTLVALDDARPYLFRAVLNESRGLLRRSRITPWERDFVEDHIGFRPDVAEAVGALPERQRAAVYLTYWRDLPVREVADLMGCRPGTIKRYLHLSRNRLRGAGAMRTELSEQSRADLRRTLGEMESLAPLAPELDKPVALRRNPRSRPQPILVALGAAAAVFAVILPIALLSGTPEAAENDPSVVPPTQVGTTAPTDPDPTAVLVDGWAITDVAQLDTIIEATDQGFVATSRSEVLASEDALTWRNIGSLGDDMFVYDIERRDGILVVASGGLVNSETGEAPAPSVWTSTDHAQTWTRTELAVSDLTVTPDGFAAVGIERDDSDPDYNKTVGVLWTSPDGLTWNEIATTEDPEGVSSSFSNIVWNDQLVILGHRGADYVSEGSGLEDSEPHENVTWFSDGSNLSAPVSSDLLGHLDADQTAVTPHGIIAMTHRMTPTVKTVGAAWISTDGTTWTELNIASGNYEYTDVGQIGDEVYLTGYDLSERDDTGMWSTNDGTTWARMEVPELPDHAILRQVEVTESAMVIAGDNNRSGFIAGRTHP